MKRPRRNWSGYLQHFSLDRPLGLTFCYLHRFGKALAAMLFFKIGPKSIPSRLFLGCIKVQLHTYGSHLNQRKKKPMAEHLKKKNHGSHLNTHGGHLVFPNPPKKIPRQVFPMMNLSCKFGSSSYNILRDRKAFVKT